MSYRALPVPLPPLVHAGHCQCACHSYPEGDVQEMAHHAHFITPRARINGLGTVSVGVAMQVEAVFACGVCQGFHCAALSGRPPELGPARRWNPPPLAAGTHGLVFGGGDGAED